jgi:hypothetical protein
VVIETNDKKEQTQWLLFPLGTLRQGIALPLSLQLFPALAGLEPTTQDWLQRKKHMCFLFAVREAQRIYTW